MGLGFGPSLPSKELLTPLGPTSLSFPPPHPYALPITVKPYHRRPSQSPPANLKFSSRLTMAAANSGTGRQKPNILITGTPGTGKSTTASALAEATSFRHICVGDLVKEKSLHDGWDDQFDSYVINEDLVSFPESFSRLICSIAR